MLHDGADARREPLAAIAKSERQRLVLGARLDTVGAGPAMRALRSARPADADEPLLGLSVVRERPHGLHDADALLVCASPVLS